MLVWYSCEVSQKSNLQGVLRFRIVMLAVVDVLFQQLRPRDVVNLRHVVAIQLESAQELVETETGMTGNLRNSNRLTRRLESTGNDNAGNVVNRDHVDRVVDVGAGRKLDTSLDHSDQEVIRVRG